MACNPCEEAKRAKLSSSSDNTIFIVAGILAALGLGFLLLKKKE